MKPPAATLSIAAASFGRTAAVWPKLALAPGWRRALTLVAIGVAAVSIVAVADISYGFHAHLPRLDLFSRIPWIVQLHMVAAMLALGIGTALLVGVKGRRFHRVAGWAWVACMMTVAISSFWIRTSGHFSFIHFISGWTSIAVPMAVAAIKRGDVRRHRAAMTNTFMGGLILAGAFTFMPGRLMWHVFVG